MPREILKYAVLGFVAAVFFLTLYALSLQPRNDRRWQDYYAHTPHVERTADRFMVTPVNDWSYSPEGPIERSEVSFTARLSDLKSVWLVLEPSSYTDLIAHTYLLFEFTGGRIVGVSVEARQEVGEKYSPWDGLFNKYELLFSWITGRDGLERRAVFLKHKVYIYPLDLGSNHRKSLLVSFLATTANLETKPRFYNTLFHNCTNELAKEMGYSWNPAFVLTGRSVAYFFRKGLIKAPSLEMASKRADITDWLRAANARDKAEFNSALLKELYARQSLSLEGAR